MARDNDLKPSYDEWMYWTQVVVDRLTTITHMYAHPPHDDVFMPEKDRQHKLSEALTVYRHLHEQTDLYDMDRPLDGGDAVAREEGLIERIIPLFRTVTELLPLWSEDMQLLLKSSWAKDCVGKLAYNLFCGPDGRENEGIGSGLPENGRLPGVLSLLLDREMAGGERAPRIEKPTQAAARMRREDLARLWVKRNSAFLRSAGRVD